MLCCVLRVQRGSCTHWGLLQEEEGLHALLGRGHQHLVCLQMCKHGREGVILCTASQVLTKADKKNKAGMPNVVRWCFGRQICTLQKFLYHSPCGFQSAHTIGVQVQVSPRHLLLEGEKCVLHAACNTHCRMEIGSTSVNSSNGICRGLLLLVYAFAAKSKYAQKQWNI